MSIQELINEMQKFEDKTKDILISIPNDNIVTIAAACFKPLSIHNFDGYCIMTVNPYYEMNNLFSYAIEDGQFSHSFTYDKLLGKEGEVITFNDFEFYILCIDGNHVQCLGHVERKYPKNKLEHEKLRNAFLAEADNLQDFE